jgi:hypothetical protein
MWGFGSATSPDTETSAIGKTPGAWPAAARSDVAQLRKAVCDSQHGCALGRRRLAGNIGEPRKVDGEPGDRRGHHEQAHVARSSGEGRHGDDCSDDVDKNRSGDVKTPVLKLVCRPANDDGDNTSEHPGRL